MIDPEHSRHVTTNKMQTWKKSQSSHPRFPALPARYLFEFSFAFYDKYACSGQNGYFGFIHDEMFSFVSPCKYLRYGLQCFGHKLLFLIRTWGRLLTCLLTKHYVQLWLADFKQWRLAHFSKATESKHKFLYVTIKSIRYLPCRTSLDRVAQVEVVNNLCT